MTIVISSVLLMSKQETSRILDPIQSAADSNQVMAPHMEPPKDSHVLKLAVSSVVHALVPRLPWHSLLCTCCAMGNAALKGDGGLFSQKPGKSSSESHACLWSFSYLVTAFLSSFLFYVIAACSNFTHACPNTAAITSIKLLGIKQNEKASLLMCSLDLKISSVLLAIPSSLGCLFRHCISLSGKSGILLWFNM